MRKESVTVSFLAFALSLSFVFEWNLQMMGKIHSG